MELADRARGERGDRGAGDPSRLLQLAVRLAGGDGAGRTEAGSPPRRRRSPTRRERSALAGPAEVSPLRRGRASPTTADDWIAAVERDDRARRPHRRPAPAGGGARRRAPTPTSCAGDFERLRADPRRDAGDRRRRQLGRRQHRPRQPARLGADGQGDGAARAARTRGGRSALRAGAGGAPLEAGRPGDRELDSQQPGQPAGDPRRPGGGAGDGPPQLRADRPARRRLLPQPGARQPRLGAADGRGIRGGAGVDRGAERIYREAMDDRRRDGGLAGPAPRPRPARRRPRGRGARGGRDGPPASPASAGMLWSCPSALLALGRARAAAGREGAIEALDEAERVAGETGAIDAADARSRPSARQLERAGTVD